MTIATGLDILLRDHRSMLGERRVGLATHAAAVTPALGSNIEALREVGVKLTALFGPEHGVRGAAGAGDAVADTVDAKTALPVYSLYGATKEPTAAMLADLDVLIVDMQDVGARYYTYISTLFHVLRGAARHGTPVMVLDRPNPITGAAVEGPLLEPGFESFVGIAPLPVRHGLTIAEIAGYLNTTFELGAELQTVAMQGWRRNLWFDEAGRSWVPTSPAMAHLGAVALYPGTCLLEGTNMALGRSTALAFEVAGAPWLDGDMLARHMNELELPGVRFRPLFFVPAAGPHAGEECQGVQVHVIDRAVLRPVALGLHLVAKVLALAPDRFAWNAAHFDRLIGDGTTRAAMMAGGPVEAIIQRWRIAEDAFIRERETFLLYS